jgi:hypothetical protein
MVGVLYACTPAVPCEGSDCASIAGHYVPAYDFDGGTLDKTGDGGVCTFVVLGACDIAQNASALTIDAGVISLSGTLYKGNTFSATGGAGGLSISLNASATPGLIDVDAGTFVPATLRGQLVGNTIDADGNTCQSIVAFEATQR